MAGSDIGAEKAEYGKEKDRWVKKRKDFEKGVDEKGAHTVSTMPRIAALSRGGPYRRNGYFYVHAKDARRKAYDKSLRTLGQNLKKAGKGAIGGVTPGSEDHARLYVYDATRAYPSGNRYNFHASFMPYSNEAHHLVPIEAIAGGFNNDELEMLGKLPYNINHGENIIFLPKKKKDTPIHALPNHSGPHKQYNSLVKGDLSKLKGQLKAKTKKECKPEDPPPIGVVDKLIKFQEKYWKFLVKRGPMNINERARKALAAPSGV